LSDTITFTGVILKSFSRQPKGGTAKLSANLTAKVTEKMAWSDFPEGATSVNLVGSLAASTCVLKPSAGELSKWVTEVEASAVKGFQAIRYELQGKKGKGFRYELHFDVHFADMKACAKLEAFMTHVGEEKASLTVSYTKAAEQLEMGEGGDDRQGALDTEDED
jgi:hypothetical protein